MAIRKALFGVAALLLLASTGALQAQPSERAGRQVFAAIQAEKAGSAPYVIRSFKKTNGITRQVFGIQVYVMEYSASVHYPKGLRPECISTGRQFAGFDCMFDQSQNGLRPQPVGGTETLTGELVFEKTERGWRGQDKGLY